jgi:class 3 adenylate cyclase
MNGEITRLQALGVLMLGLAVATSPAQAQVSEAALKDRVAQLVERLESPKMEARAAAEKSLIDLGPKILPLLPAGAEASKKDLGERLDRVKAAIHEKEEVTNLGASKVTIQGKAIRLTEAIKALQAQSGNLITDLREANGAEATNPALELEIVDKTFFEALDEIAEKAGVTINAYTGDGSIGLMAGMMADGTPKPDMGKPLVVYSGPFRIQLKQIAIIKDYPSANGKATAQLDVMWEPRLRPMLLSIKNEDISVTDDQKKVVAPQVAEQSDETALKADNCAAEVNLDIAAPERAAKLLASLKVKATLTVPSGMMTFKFPSLAASNVTQKQGDVSVTLEETEVDEQVWKVGIVINYPEGGPAFESYRQGLFNNKLWLQKPDGSRFDQNGGFNNAGSDDGKMAFEYLFVDAPGKPADHQLVYETPKKVVPIVLEFEFKDVPLP